MKSAHHPFTRTRLERLFPRAVIKLAIGCLSSSVPAGAQTWTQTTAPVANWVSVASSADGMRLAALTLDGQAVLISTNGGTNWTWSYPTNGVAMGSSITCSADGSVLASCGFIDPTGGLAGDIIISTNSGTSWFVSTAPHLSWTGVSSSADGTMLVGVSAFRKSVGGGIMTSADSGTTWNPTTAASVNVAYNAVASRADGLQVMAATDFIDVSGNGGATWSQTFAPGSAWESVAASADGKQWVAASGNNGSGGGPIYLSSDSGVTWTPSSAPITNWVSIASSADGTRLVAVAAGTGTVPIGAIYQSTNSGATWTTPPVPVGNWSSVASSADGTKLVAAIHGGHIYTLRTTPSVTLNLAVVSWVVPSTSVVLQQNTDLASSNWVNVPGTPVLNLTNLREEITVSPTNGATFYRLVGQ